MHQLDIQDMKHHVRRNPENVMCIPSVCPCIGLASVGLPPSLAALDHAVRMLDSPNHPLNA